MVWYLSDLPLRVFTHVEKRGSAEPFPNREHIVHLPLKSFHLQQDHKGAMRAGLFQHHAERCLWGGGFCSLLEF